MSELTTSNHINLAAEIVSAFVSNNSVPSAELPELIASVHSALAKVANGQTEKPAEAPVPPVSIKKSITPDHLISLEDGRRYKSLKRHLKGRGLSPEQYREKWGLPRDYPMVAPNYAKQRSELAKALGLGQLRRNRAAGSEPAAQVETTPEPTKGARGRRKRTAEAA
ncbi:MAG TPA: MucR family transcriptional regulator [Gemmatimonadales bacterium]|nr:MucR family transcriptional regulator [Gemmatimonadales bacterium]